MSDDFWWRSDASFLPFFVSAPIQYADTFGHFDLFSGAVTYSVDAPSLLKMASTDDYDFVLFLANNS